MPEQFTGKVDILNSTNQLVYSIDPDSGFVQITYRVPSTGFPIMRLTNTASLNLWGDGDNYRARLDGSIATLFLGGPGAAGVARLRNPSREDVIVLDASNAAIYVGRTGNEGDIIVRDGSGRDVFTVNGSSAAVYAGADGNAGDLVVRDGSGRDVFTVNGSNAAVYVGATGNEGDIIVRDGSGRDVFQVDGNNAAVYIGANGNEGDLIVRNGAGADVVHINGNTGDIIFSNADCAEEFDVASADIEPGSVVVLGDEGDVRLSSTPYDRRVAGVVAGAGDFKPGIILDRRETGRLRKAVTLMGKAFCRVDASTGPIAVGDMLTTSGIAGYAMKACDSTRAFGAVIGKALRPLKEGRGLVPVLVSLK